LREYNRVAKPKCFFPQGLKHFLYKRGVSINGSKDLQYFNPTGKKY